MLAYEIAAFVPPHVVGPTFRRRRRHPSGTPDPRAMKSYTGWSSSCRGSVDEHSIGQLLICHEKVADAVCSLVSVADTVTVAEPRLVGWPEMSPDRLIRISFGSPTAEK